ncbi:CoF synthetase [Microbacterium marinilacus]|nr:CoF synthetase [Microbacterium marinilacus]
MITAQDRLVRALRAFPATHRLLLAPGFEPLRWQLGRWRAYRTFEHAARRVPAYRAFLRAHRCPVRLPEAGSPARAWTRIPEMDKASYIRQYPITERCVDGRLPRRGVVVDESSGSSGVPTSWVRGPAERAATRDLLQLGYANTAQGLTKQPFLLNAFSLGAWATGMNVTSSLTDRTMMKSIGPDKDKIIQTMKEFGPDYTYIITSYPPFLKDLFDDDRLDWSRYDIVCAYGGEGISESMRDRILKTAKKVLGSYGASDLEINIALENDFTIALRRAILADPRLQERLTRMGVHGVLPAVFQFNPYEYYIESNAAGELVVTINRAENINPRVRYNIHDRGHVARFRDVAEALTELGHEAVLDERILDLPVLFLYGRSDLSVDFNGAVVPPDGLRDAVQADPELFERVANHRLVSYEDADGSPQLHLAVQLHEGVAKPDAAEAAARVLAAMRRANGDFHNAIRTSAEASLPTFGVYEWRTGVFSEDGRKLKNEYVWHLDAAEAAAAGLVVDAIAARFID